jgi:EAL domain-containing protein (putative c-di-GMP-specific phosphodiesterase class I)/PAS domain-containing protein
MANGLKPFRVLITAAESQTAEAVLRSLHRARLPAKGMFTQRPHKLPQLVAEHDCDLIIVCLAGGTAAGQAVAGYRKLGKPLPLVAVHDPGAAPEDLLALLHAGAALIVPDDDDEALVAGVRRQIEIGSLATRVDELSARADGASRALRQMAMQSIEPVAYLCNGRIADANRAFQELFQAPGGGWFSDRALAELVSAEHKDRVEAELSAGVAATTSDVRPEPLQFVDARGQVFDRRLAVQPTGAADDACLYVVLKAAAPEAESAPENVRAASGEPARAGGAADKGATMQMPAGEAGADLEGPGAAISDDDGITTKIERALHRDGFNIMYQPVISLLGDSQENYSVLLRLEDINNLILTAAQLLGPAARSGTLPDIDRWVIGRALRDLAARRNAGQRIGFFLSLSAETIKDPGLLIWLCDLLREHDARGGWVIFQLQERDAKAQSDHWVPLADGLKKIKSRIAINQFGHEPHPERLLERVPPDFVKFAPDFAAGLADDIAKQRQLAELARLARSYGAKTIVTGVEDARALTVLWGAGIDYVQGNFLQGPSRSLDAPV